MVHARQLSSDLLAIDKEQALLSSTSNPSMMCGYSSPSMYPNAGVSGGWPYDGAQTYNPGVGSLTRNESQRRWSASVDPIYRPRDRRVDCRLVPPQSHMIPSQSPQSELSTPPYIGSPEFVRAQTFQPQYPRSSVDIQSPMSSWGGWDVEAPEPPSMNAQVPPSSWNNQLHVEIPSFNSYNNLVFSGSDSSTSSSLYTPPEQPIPLNGYSFPHRLSPDFSPSPSPDQYDIKPILPVASSPICSRRKLSEDRPESGKSCSHCHATTTPLWRRDPSTMKPLCNACGLYLQQRNKLRPQELIDADDDGSTSEESDPNYVGPECSHCRTHHTSVWRRSKSGDQLCNACGVYARLRGKLRPLSLKKNKIRPRSKHLPK